MKNNFIFNTERIIREALKEDIGRGDLTTNILVPPQAMAEAEIIMKEPAVICGMEIVSEVFKVLDRQVKIKILYPDGKFISKPQRVAVIKAKARAILTGERVALNFLGHLSGIATTTRAFVQAVKPYPAKILDTRKTQPGLRFLEKMAVRCGGGYNHRIRLDEMAMIKDNHLAFSKEEALEKIIHRYRKQNKTIEIEVTSLNQFQKALSAGTDIILLDNMNFSDMSTAVKMKRQLFGKRPPLLEASGGINLQNVRRIAQTGVDRISIGALTHSVKAINVSLELLS